MIDLTKIEGVYLILGYTDMRKQIDGLLAIIKNNHQDHLLQKNQIFIFCSKNKTKIKILEIDYSGIWVYYKRTNGDKFIWPKKNDIKLISKRQLLWLLEGVSIEQKHAHKERTFDL